jgi:hypothetical protein
MNNTIDQIESSLENPVTVPLYTFIILGSAIFALFTALCCTCCCNHVVCCCPWRQAALEDARSEPMIIGAPPNSNIILRSREIVGRRRGTGV